MKKPYIIATILCIILASCLNNNVEEKTAEDYFHIGTDNFNANNSYSAKLYLDSAIKIKPNYMEAFFTRGMVNMSLGLLNDACDDFHKADEFGHVDAKKAIDKYCNKPKFGSKKYLGLTIYYANQIPEYLVGYLGNFLIRQGFATDNERQVFLNYEDNTYQFKMPLKKGLERDEEYTPTLKSFAKLMSDSIFNGTQVDILGCDDELNTLRVYPMSSY